MKKAPVFLNIEHVKIIHERMIREFGGAGSIRDEGLLESAVTMARAQFEGVFLHKNLGEMAGAYLFHLCRNHRFVDGNKRTALTAAAVFLLLNQAKLTATNKQIEKLTFGVADGSLSKEQVLEFFRHHVEIE